MGSTLKILSWVLLLACLVGLIGTFKNGESALVLKHSLWPALVGMGLGLALYFMTFGRKSEGDLIAIRRGEQIGIYSFWLSAFMSVAVAVLMFCCGFVGIAAWRFWEVLMH